MITNQYRPGKVYLVRSSSDRFWWELRNVKDLEVIIRPLSSTLQQELEYSSGFTDKRTVAILPPSSYELPPSLTPASNTTCFIWMGRADSSMSSKAEKAYSKLAGGAYVQVDLRSKKEADEPEIAELLVNLRASHKDDENLEEKINNLLIRFKEKPCRLLYQLQQADPFSWEDPDLRREELARAIESLGKPESLRLWGNLSNRALFSYLVEPSGMGVNSKEQVPFGMPVTLWMYQQIFVEHLLSSSSSNNLQLTYKLFAVWVYLASTRWTDRTGRGIYEFSYKYGKLKGKTGIGFEPSKLALSCLHQMLFPL